MAEVQYFVSRVPEYCNYSTHLWETGGTRIQGNAGNGFRLAVKAKAFARQELTTKTPKPGMPAVVGVLVMPRQPANNMNRHQA